MLNRNVQIGVLVVLLLAASVSTAAAAAKVGVVDIGVIMDESLAGQEADQLLQAFVAERQQVVDEMEVELDALAAAIEEADSEEARHAAQAQFDDLLAAIQRQVQEFEKEIEAVLDDFRGQILSDIRLVLRLYGEEHGYDLIMEAGSVAYFDEAMDITLAVIAKYDELLLDSRAMQEQ